MLKKIIILLLIFLCCVCFCLGQSKASREEYAVYANVLRSIYRENRRDYSNKSHFILLQKSKAGTDLSTPAGRKYKALITSFANANKTAVTTEKKLLSYSYFKTYYLISQGKINKLFKEGQIQYEKQVEQQKSTGIRVADVCNSTPWQPFYLRYPEAKGYYSLSRVGFSNSLAMVQIRHEDACSGFSRTYVLKKSGRNWRIITSMGSEWIA